MSDERRLTLLAYACLLMMGINAGWIGPFLPQISRLVHVSIDQAGLLVSAWAGGYFVAVLITGEISQSWSARAILIGAMLLLGAGLFAIAGAPILSVLLCGGFLVGLANGSIEVAGNALIVDLNRERLASALNYLHVLFGVGALLGPIIVGVALARLIPYSIVFWAGAGACALIAISLMLTPAFEVHLRVKLSDGFLPLLARPIIWVIGGVLFLYVGAETGIGAWLYLYLRKAGALRETVAAWGVSLYWLGLILGRLLGGRIGQRFSLKGFTIFHSALSALAIAVLIAVPRSHGVAAVMVILIGFGYGPIFPNLIAVGAARFPSEVGRMTSIVVAGGALGAVFVPWIMGYAVASSSVRVSMEFALAITAMMALLIGLGLQVADSPKR